MINLLEFEGKTEEEVLKNIKTDDVHFKLEEIPGKLFKGKKYKLIAIEKNEIKNIIKDFISKFSKSIDKKINVEIREIEDGYNIMLICDDNAVIIGRDGKTINSIQLLLHQMISNKTGFNIRINVDAANYKANKTKKLEYEIKNIAKEVISSKIDVKLDPMNSYERRIVHNVIGNYKELKSESVGEDPIRYVVISFKED